MNICIFSAKSTQYKTCLAYSLLVIFPNLLHFARIDAEAENTEILQQLVAEFPWNGFVVSQSVTPCAPGLGPGYYLEQVVPEIVFACEATWRQTVAKLIIRASRRSALPRQRNNHGTRKGILEQGKADKTET